MQRSFYRLGILAILLWTAWNLWQFWSVYGLLYGDTPGATFWDDYAGRLSAFYSRDQFLVMWADPLQHLRFADSFYDAYWQANLQTWFIVTMVTAIVLLLVRLVPTANES